MEMTFQNAVPGLLKARMPIVGELERCTLLEWEWAAGGDERDEENELTKPL